MLDVPAGHGPKVAGASSAATEPPSSFEESLKYKRGGRDPRSSPNRTAKKSSGFCFFLAEALSPISIGRGEQTKDEIFPILTGA